MNKRTIKFRAWDNEAKKMILINPIAAFHHMMTWEGLVYENGELKDFEMMQFTGLHDKNGKEIHEGDIVEVANKNLAGFGNRSIVTWFESEAAFGTRSKKGNGYLTKIAIEDGEWKVIGSIYENPELLKS